MSVKLKMKKGGMKFKKKSSLKLLSHSQPNFAEMSLVAIGPVISEEKIVMGISHRVLC
jgi:hypothetical protein